MSSSSSRPPESADRAGIVAEHVVRARLFGRSEETSATALPGPSRLRRERRSLLRLRENLLRDLGGLMLEMVRRDQFRQDLLLERCAELTELDARLAELDGLLAVSFSMRRTAGRALRLRRTDPSRRELLPALWPAGCPGGRMNDQGGICPRCATPFEPGQGYCLECGLRLDPDAPPPEQDAPPSAAAPPPKNRTWIWATLGGLVVAAAGAAVAIAVSGNGGGSTLTVTTTVAPVVTATVPATDPGAVPPAPTTTVAVTTVATVPTVPEDTATTATGAKPTLIVWPGKAAYTVVLDSLPSPGGHAAALARANQALAKGLPQVGVLDSGDFSSLNPGYYVVFSGVYKTLLLAEVGSRNARFKGFGSAYPRQIRP